jgi:hypothetical protein
MHNAAHKKAVADRIDSKLANLGSFANHHGITRANIRQFVVDPFLIEVDPDDGIASSAIVMWVVLKERNEPKSGYAIVYDVERDSWGVAESDADGRWSLVVGADSFEEALSAM